MDLKILLINILILKVTCFKEASRTENGHHTVHHTSDHPTKHNSDSSKSVHNSIHAGNHQNAKVVHENTDVPTERPHHHIISHTTIVHESPHFEFYKKIS